jgi:parallel beta-helix repeat protein
LLDAPGTFNFAQNVTFSGNTVYDNWAVGVYVGNVNGASIEGNLIYNTGDPTYFRDGAPMVGLLVGSEEGSGNPSGATFANNIIEGGFVAEVAPNATFWNSSKPFGTAFRGSAVGAFNERMGAPVTGPSEKERPAQGSRNSGLFTRGMRCASFVRPG